MSKEPDELKGCAWMIIAFFFGLALVIADANIFN